MAKKKKVRVNMASDQMGILLENLRYAGIVSDKVDVYTPEKTSYQFSINVDNDVMADMLRKRLLSFSVQAKLV